jgi:hypothetical protein
MPQAAGAVGVLVRQHARAARAGVVYRREPGGRQALRDVQHPILPTLAGLLGCEILALADVVEGVARQFRDPTVQVPAFITEEPPVLGITGLRRDAGKLERLAVVPTRVASAVVDGDGMVRSNFVQVLSMERHVEFGVVEHVRADPEAGRCACRLLRERLLQLFHGANVGVHFVELVDAARMAVRIDEARRDRHAIGVDDLGPAARQVPDVAAAAYGNEFPVLDREGLGPGLRIVNRVDAGVDHHHVSLVRSGSRHLRLGFRRAPTPERGSRQHATQPQEFGSRHLRHRYPQGLANGFARRKRITRPRGTAMLGTARDVDRAPHQR